MNKLFVVLACLVGMTTAGIWDRSSLMGLDRSRTERIDTDRILSMTQDELLRQKFLLDVLMHVQQPLVDEQLLELGKTLIFDQGEFEGQIDDEIVHIIELCRTQRLLGKQDIYTITNDDHLRQMIGLYRMLLRSRTWDTFQRNVCFARIHINGVLFANSLLLAVRDRQDTRNLIVPAIHEILPELFYGESLVRKAQNIDINVLISDQDMQSRKPGLFDMIGMVRRKPLAEQRIDMLDRSQLWMPWRELRLEMAMRRTNGESTRTLLRQDDKLVLQGEGSTTLLSEDVGLNDLVHNLINELVLQERDLRRDDIRSEQRLGLGRVELRKNEGGIDRLMDQRRRTDDDDDEDDVRRSDSLRMRGTNVDRDGLLEQRRRTDDDDDEDDVRRSDSLRMRGTNVDRDGLLQQRRRTDDDVDEEDGRRSDRLRATNADMDRVLRVGRRRQNPMLDDDMETERWVQRGRIVDGRRIVEQRNDILQRQRQLDRDDEVRLRGIQSRDIYDLPATTIDDERLLHINRRRLQDIAMWGRERSDMNNQRERFMNIVRGSRVSDGRRTLDVERDMDTRRNTLSRDDMQRQRWTQNLDDERRMDRDQQERRMRMDVMSKGRISRDDRIEDTELPSRNIDDERLLRVNRRNWIRRDIDDDDDDRQMRSQMIDRRNKDVRQRVGDERRSILLDREQQCRDIEERQRLRNQYADAGKWLRRNIDDERILSTDCRHQQMDNDNRRDRFLDMVRGGIRDGRKILVRDDDDSWTLRQRNDDDERMLNKNERLRWGRIVRDDDEESIKLDKRRGMEDIGTERRNIDREADRWNRRQQLEDDQQDLRRDNIGSGMERDRLLTTSRRRMHMNDADNTDELTINNLRRRIPRSLRLDINNELRQNMLDMRSGEQLLHNLQQLMARINLERIALGITDRDIDRQTERGIINNQRLIQEARDERYALRLNEMRLDTRRNRLMLEQINRIEERLQGVLDQRLRGARLDNQDDVNRVLGEVLLGRVEGAGILQILRELLIQSRDTQVDKDMMTSTLRANLLRCPVMQHLLRRIVKLIDLQRQQLGGYKREDIALDGIRINDVAVDQLRTYVELDDADLINLLDQRLTLQRQDQDRQVLQKMLVARQQRLNHKSFKINIDLTADRDQRVVIRTMLLPKVDGDDRSLSLEEARLNALHIDATIADLRAGRNTINRRSRDILWTTRDTTPLSEIYRRVMRAIEGERGDIVLEPVVGNNCRLPHRLLLPRGRVEGLPMQLLVLITPLRDDLRNWQQDIRDDHLCRIGTSTRFLDRLPLGFPLDRKIVDETQLIKLPNLRLRDVVIYHEDKVSNNNVL